MTRTSLTESIIQYVEQEAALLVFTLDSSGRILNANRYAERLVGKELPQKKLSDVVVDFTGSVKLPDLINEPERVHLINIETAGGLPQTFYFRFLRAGSEILAIGELNSLELENLRKELVTANNELSNLGREFQKKNAELAKLNDLNKQLLGVVRTSEERYRLVVENANEAVAVAQDDMFKFVNRMACEITGFSEGELLSRPFVDIIHRDDRSMVMDRHMRRLRGEAVQDRYPFRLLGKDGSTRWVENGACLVEWEGRAATLNLLTDITEHMQAEAERTRLEAENRQLQKAESLGRMAGAIAHIFNNQLAVVMGNLELALMDLSEDDIIRKDLIEAMRAARRSADVSGLMLTYLGQTTDKGEPLDLSDVCRHNLPMLRDDMPEGIALETGLLSPGPVVQANVNQMQQVLTHLITNGWESIGHSAGTVTLATRIIPASEIPKSHLTPVGWKPAADAFSCLEVTDTGCGMTEEDLDKIFDPFFTTKFTGRGLGLAVVLGMVKAWGGAIGVESKLNQGSTFRIFLPLITDELPHLSEKAAEANHVEQGVTVLLVEDQDVVRKMAESMLKRLDHQVLAASGGAEALELFRENPDQIRCVITDLTMPGMDGWETLAALREIRPHIPVVMVSGHDEAHAMNGNYSERPQVFLHKPYSMGDLKAAIDRALKKPVSTG